MARRMRADVSQAGPATVTTASACSLICDGPRVAGAVCSRSRSARPRAPPWGRPTSVEVDPVACAGLRSNVLLGTDGQLIRCHSMALAPRGLNSIPAAPQPSRGGWRGAPSGSLPPVRLITLTPGTDLDLAVQLLHVQRAAYRVEAQLLGDDRIPPLHEPLEQLQQADLHWRGALDEHDGTLLGAVAWTETAGEVDIDRLVVDPDAHRQGTGSALVRAVLDRAAGRRTTVTTGRANHPALMLYERQGFSRLGDVEVLPGLWITRLDHAG